MESYLTVERPLGTFSFYHKRATRYQAMNYCAEKDSILAPITEKADFDALSAAYNKKDFQSPRSFHVGLEIAHDNSGRVFVNGKAWDQEKHGAFYKEAEYIPEPNECLNSLFVPGFFPKKMVIDYQMKCHLQQKDFVCFKPKKTGSSGALIADEGSSVAVYGAAGFAAGFAFCCLLAFVGSFYKKSSKTSVEDSVEA